MPVEQNTFPQAGDPDDAVRFAQLVGHDILVDYVQSGLELDADFSTGQIIVGSGVSRIGITESDATSDGITLENLGYVVQTEETTLDIPNSGSHTVVVDPNLDTTDNPNVDLYEESDTVPEWAITVGTVDVDSEFVVEENRNPNASIDRLDVTGSYINPVYSSIGDIPTKYAENGAQVAVEDVGIVQYDGSRWRNIGRNTDPHGGPIRRVLYEGESMTIEEEESMIVLDYFDPQGEFTVEGDFLILDSE